jgi:hypothetical protein
MPSPDEGIVGDDTQHKETDNRVTSAGCPDTMPRDEIRKILGSYFGREMKEARCSVAPSRSYTSNDQGR